MGSYLYTRIAFQRPLPFAFISLSSLICSIHSSHSFLLSLFIPWFEWEQLIKTWVIGCRNYPYWQLVRNHTSLYRTCLTVVEKTPNNNAVLEMMCGWSWPLLGHKYVIKQTVKEKRSFSMWACLWGSAGTIPSYTAASCGTLSAYSTQLRGPKLQV